MLNISERPLTEAETQELEVAISTPNVFYSGCLSAFAYYGLFLVLIPFTGSILALLLATLFHVPGPAALIVGFALGSAFSTWLIWRAWRGERRIFATANAKDAAARSGGMATVVEFEAEAAWIVEDFDEDIGPGYLFRVDNQQFVFAYLSYIERDLEPWDSGELPGRHVTIDVLPVTNRLLSVDWGGEPIPVRPEPVPAADIPLTDFSAQYALLQADSFSERLRALLTR
jgi:hypothetical protein